MSKIILMFPGVGSQKTGMGKYFFDNFKIARKTFEEAGDVLKVDFSHLCFSPLAKGELNKLENAQAALVTVSTAAYRVYQEEVGIKPLYVLGHSLGEYSALNAAGVISFASTLELVWQRGTLLSQSVSSLEGMMVWVINLDYRIVKKICSESTKEGKQVFVSAYDSPVQTSISGLKTSVMEVGRRLEKAGAIVYPLRLSGPFHCPLMQEAAEQMTAILREYTFTESHYPVIANQNASLYKGKENVVENLVLQLIRPIRWQDSICNLVENGVNTAVEIGPDKVLKHLVKNNTDAIHTYSFNTGSDLEILKHDLKSIEKSEVRCFVE